MRDGTESTTTVLCSAVEGATVLWEEHPAAAEALLSLHAALLDEVFVRNGGRVFATGDDGFVVAFEHAAHALEAASAAQRALAEHAWPDGVRLRCRMGIEAGTAHERAGHLVGPAPNRAARIMAVAGGDHVLIGARAAALLDGARLVDLGVHRIADLPDAERLYQAYVDDLPPIVPSQLAEPHRGNLAIPGSSLIGREREIADLVPTVRDHRLVTLTGVGGVGKTRLALDVAASLAHEHPDGVWLIELATVVDGPDVADLIATTLGVAARDEAAMVHTIAEALSGRRVLLVLDNCEHVVDAVAHTVRELLARTSIVRVLATSRVPLDVPGEQRRLVLPLDVDGGASSPAVALFVERARALQSRIDFADDETAAAVHEICRTLDGLPLGIELAAARTISMSPIDMRARLGDRFRLLAAPSHLPLRQQTLRNVVGWSYDLLGDEQRSLLRHAAVFPGGFDARSLAAVVGTTDDVRVLDGIDSLVRQSLVTVSDVRGSTRYALLETIRQFAEDELDATGALETTRDRHAVHFAAEASARWTTWNGPAWRACGDWLVTELANLRAAFRWSWARGDLDTAVDVAAHAALMGASLQLFETVGWAQELLADARRADVPRLPRLCVGAAWGCFTGRPDDAVAAAEEAGRLEVDPRYEPCEPGLSGLIEALANVYAGHLDRYVEAATRVVALGGRAQGWGLSLLLDGLQASGRIEEALALTDAAMDAARALGNPYFIAYAHWTAGGAHANVDPERALADWRDGLAYVRRHRVDFFVGFIARDAARLRLVDADPDDALAMFDAAIEAFDDAGNVPQLTITLASATALFERLGSRERAAALYGAIIRQPGSDHHVPELASLADRLATMMGDDAFDAASASVHTTDLHELALFCRSEIQRARHELREAAAARAARPGGLSTREVDVLELVATGCSTRAIAERLFISAKTADRHIQNLYTKIGVSNRAAATRWALEHGVAR